jgi:hypothetical protein
MDTRSKIVAEAAQARGAAVVCAYFDILQPWHIEELARIKAAHAALAAVVLPLASELLSQQARVELAASLRMVDYVIAAGPGELEAILARLEPAEIVRLEEADLRRRGELIEHVHRRQIR